MSSGKCRPFCLGPNVLKLFVIHVWHHVYSYLDCSLELQTPAHVSLSLPQGAQTTNGIDSNEEIFMNGGGDMPVNGNMMTAMANGHGHINDTMDDADYAASKITTGSGISRDVASTDADGDDPIWDGPLAMGGHLCGAPYPGFRPPQHVLDSMAQGQGYDSMVVEAMVADYHAG